jgi:hypothetical protein
MSEQLMPEHFLPHLKKTFQVRGGRYGVTLAEMKVPHLTQAEKASVPRQPFTLIFHGPPGDVLREGSYMFDLDGGPSFELYVMPIQTFVRDRQDYQAAFN